MVKIDYSYRDADNYKQHARAYFKGTLSDAQIADIRSVLDDGTYFIPGQVGMDELQWKFPSFPTDSDHVWHELQEDAITVEEDDDDDELLPVTDLYAAFMRIKETGWDIDGAMKRLGIEA